ncbi:MAG: hypothetical protein JXR51_13825 [Bacteroidales bacterium]|nr:hypothetical protein [Bacteroidales bacterium]MBN2758246.1 hypothetical protein [Bacteroidales bacterium]
MNNYQSAKYASYKLMVFEADAYATSVALVPKFAKAIGRLKEICAEVDVIRVEQEKDIKGVTGDKHQTLDMLIDSMVDVSGALQSYALEKSNNTLYESISFSESSIERLPHAEVVSAASLIIKEADKLSAEVLTAEGISADDIAEFKTLYDEFSKNYQTPRQAIIERTNYTENLRKLFNEAGTLKKDVLDKLISQYKRKDSEFYLKYNAASNVILRHSKSNGTAETATETETINE